VQKKLRSGVKSVIVRRELGNCCDWCKGIAGVYDYSDAPADIFRRHDNCRCMVTVRTKRGTYQDAWSKKEYKSQRGARIARTNEIEKQGNQLDELNRIKRKAKSNGERFADTTDYWRNLKHELGIVEDADAVTVNGVRYKADGKNVKLKPKPGERETAKILADLFGGIVEMLPDVNMPEGIKSADYAVNGIRFDRKGPSGTGKNTIKNNIGEAVGQALNVVLDLSNCPMDTTLALRYCREAYNYRHLSFLDMLVVIKDGEVLKVFERT